jgi:hypothetical protein
VREKFVDRDRGLDELNMKCLVPCLLRQMLGIMRTMLLTQAGLQKPFQGSLKFLLLDVGLIDVAKLTVSFLLREFILTEDQAVELSYQREMSDVYSRLGEWDIAKCIS